MRRVQYQLFNSAPTLAPTQVIEDSNGVILGTLGGRDVDGDVLTYAVITRPVHGDLTIYDDGSYRYVPDADFAHSGGTDSFTVTVDDTTANPWHLRTTTATATVHLTEQPVDHAPTIELATGVPDPVTGALTVTVSTTDPDGDPITVTASSPVHGSLVDNGSGSYTYTPSATTVGTDTETATVTDAARSATAQDTLVIDTLTFTATDPGGASAAQTLTVFAPNSVATTIAAGEAPRGVVISPDGHTIYVAGQNDGTISAIDTHDNEVIATIKEGLPGLTGALAISPDGKTLYAGSANLSGHLYVIDTATYNVTVLNVGRGRQGGLAVTPDGTTLYIANTGLGTVTVLNLADNTAVDVPVGSLPTGVAFSPDGTTAFVANQGSGSVSVIDTTLDPATETYPTVIKTVSVGESPTSLAINSDGTRVYVTNADSGTLSVLDTTNDNSVIATVALGNHPDSVALNADGTIAYVTNRDADTVAVIDTTTNNVVDTIAVGADTFGVVVTPDGQTVYAAASNAVAVISHSVFARKSPNLSIDAEIHQTNGAYIVKPHINGADIGNAGWFDAMLTTSTPVYGTLVSNGDGSFTYTPDDLLAQTGGTVILAFTATNTKTGAATTTTKTLNIAPATPANGVIANLKVASPEGNGRVGAPTNGVVFSPDGTTAYTISNNDPFVPSISVIDVRTNTVKADISLGPSSEGAYAVAVSPDGTKLYVTLVGEEVSYNTIKAHSFFSPGKREVESYYPGRRWVAKKVVLVVDTTTNTVKTTPIVVGSAPMSVVFGLDGTAAYVTNHDSNTVSVIDVATDKVVATIPVGVRPDSVAISPDGASAYVTNTGSGTVSVINTASNAVIRTIAVGAEVKGVAISPDGTTLYVAGRTAKQGGTVSVIDAATGAVTKQITVGSDVTNVVISPDGKTLYAKAVFTTIHRVAWFESDRSDDNKVVVIDAATGNVTATVSPGFGSPNLIAISPDGTALYVTKTSTRGAYDNRVSVIATGIRRPSAD